MKCHDRAVQELSLNITPLPSALTAHPQRAASATVGMTKTIQSLVVIVSRNHISSTMKLRNEGTTGDSPTASTSRQEPSDRISLLLIKGIVRGLHPRTKTYTEAFSILTWCFLSYALISEGYLGVETFHKSQRRSAP